MKEKQMTLEKQKKQAFGEHMSPHFQKFSKGIYYVYRLIVLELKTQLNAEKLKKKND